MQKSQASRSRLYQSGNREWRFFRRWHGWSRCCRWSMSFAVRIRPRSNSCTSSIVVIRMNTKVDTLIEQRISTLVVKCSRNISPRHLRVVIQRRDWSLSSIANSLLNGLRLSFDTFVRKIERFINACILNYIIPKCISSKEDTRPSSNIQENSAYLNSIARWSMATFKMLIKSIGLIRNKTRNSPADDDVSEYRTFVLACRSLLNQQRARPIVLRIFATIFVTRALLLQINPEFFLLLLLHHIDEWQLVERDRAKGFFCFSTSACVSECNEIVSSLSLLASEDDQTVFMNCFLLFFFSLSPSLTHTLSFMCPRLERTPSDFFCLVLLCFLSLLDERLSSLVFGIDEKQNKLETDDHQRHLPNETHHLFPRPSSLSLILLLSFHWWCALVDTQSY